MRHAHRLGEQLRVARPSGQHHQRERDHAVDEGEDSANHVLTLIIRPNSQAFVSGRYYDHYSLLATIEDLLGVRRLGSAAGATPMRDLVISGVATRP